MIASEVRLKFGTYKDFVFEFEFTNSTPEVIRYICDFAPEGWDSQSLQFVRSRSKWGVFRSYTADLSFCDTDYAFLESYLADFKTEGDLKLNIYQIINETNDYDLLYSGKVDLSKYEKKDYKFKISLIDTDLANYIEVNGGKEYEVAPNTEVQPQFLYSGIPIMETGYLIGKDDLPTYENSYSEVRFQPSIGNTSISVDATVSQIQPQQFDAYQTTPYSLPFFIAGRDGFLNINGTFNTVIERDNISSIDISFRKADGTLLDNLISESFSPYISSKFYQLTLDSTLNLAKEDEVYLIVTVILYAPTGQIWTLEFDTDVKCEFTETIISKQFQYYKLKELTELMLSKVTEGKFTSVELTDDLIGTTATSDTLIITNGSWSKGFNAKVKLNDLLELIQKKLGKGYELTATGIKFSPIADFFGSTALLQFDEVKGFAERSLPDYLFNTISTGEEPFDSEYLAGYYAPFEKSIFKTPVNSVKNELNLVPSISSNPFEIESMARGIGVDEDKTDQKEDDKLYLISVLYNGQSGPKFIVKRPALDYANSSTSGIEPYIYNVELSPIRTLERNLLMVHPSLINDTDLVKVQARTKNADFYSTIDSLESYYENLDFKIMPRCTATTGPFLTGDNYKIEAIQYEFTAPTEDFDIRTILNNTTKLILFSYNGVRRAGYLDDFTNNPYSQEAKTIKLIKAHLTSEEIDALWL